MAFVKGNVAIKAQREVEAYLHSFLQLALDRMSGQFHFPTVLASGNNPVIL
jgi:hypothetical protein